MPEEHLCDHCPRQVLCKSSKTFMQHLREVHCSQEGGSYVCKYGYNGVCSSLPVEGVSDKDYEQHVLKQHLGGGARPDFLRSHTDGTEEKRRSIPSSTRTWSLYSASQNLATVLNDPNRGKQKDLFTKTWGESFIEKSVVPNPRIPEVTLQDLATYLRKTSKRYRKMIKRKTSGRGGRMSASSEDSAHPPQMDQLVQLFPKLSALRVQHNVIGDLSSIPKVFLSQSFDLSKLDQFRAVFPSGWNASKLLQEQLTHYLDIVEINIAAQIAQNSEAYFKAMTCHDVLITDLNQTKVDVHNLRKEVNRLQNAIVSGPMLMISVHQERQKAGSLLKKLKLMRTVHQTQPTIQLLLATSDFVGALDLISTTQEVLAEYIGDLRCFRHLGTQLKELEKMIGKMLATDFYRWVTAHLNRPLVSGENVAEDAYVRMEKDKLTAIVCGLVKLTDWHAILETLREEGGAALKAVVKQIIAETLSACEGSDVVENGLDRENSPSSQDGLGSLRIPAWFAFFKRLSSKVEALLRRVKALHILIRETVVCASGRSMAEVDSENPAGASAATDDADSAAMTQEELEKLTNGLDAGVVWSCNMAHERIARVILASGRCLERSSANDYQNLTRCIKAFSAATHDICGKKSSHVWSALQGQTQKFISKFHDGHRSKLTLLLDNERWQAARVPEELQILVGNIVNHGTFSIARRLSDPEECLPESKAASQALAVEGQSFIVVGVVLMLVRMICEYCECASENPMLAADLVTRLSDLLGLYNARMSQLLLGAGALSSAGLRTISARNLALGWRSLQLIQVVLPRIRQHYADLLPNRSAGLRQLDNVGREMENHGMGLCSKLSQIVENGMEVQLNRWDVKPPVPSPTFKSICKQLAKLHEAISDVLPPSQIDAIYSRVHSSFRARVHGHLVKAGIANDGGPQHGLITSELTFYVEQLKSLKCLAEPKKLDSFHAEVWND